MTNIAPGRRESTKLKEGGRVLPSSQASPRGGTAGGRARDKKHRRNILSTVQSSRERRSREESMLEQVVPLASRFPGMTVSARKSLCPDSRTQSSSRVPFKRRWAAPTSVRCLSIFQPAYLYPYHCAGRSEIGGQSRILRITRYSRATQGIRNIHVAEC